MAIGCIVTEGTDARLAAYKARASAIRERARRLFLGRGTASQIAAAICEETDAFLIELLQSTADRLVSSQQELLASQTALVAVGGSGRGELAPYSDADLLFLYQPAAAEPFAECAAEVVRHCWDAGVKLGHSIRTVRDSLQLSCQDPQVATTLLESRRLWGSEELFAAFVRRFQRHVVRRRRRAFLNDVIAARDAERAQHGGTVHQLEPDLKRSAGGLRDVHLIRWVGYACYGTPDIAMLRLHGALDKEDARELAAAQEFLMHLRVDLHLSANRAQDVLTREEQLRIASERNIAATAGQRPVERFMQTYFRHSAAIANIADRFVARHRPRSWGSRVVGFLATRRLDDVFWVGPAYINVARRQRPSVVRSLPHVLKLYYLASQFGVVPAPALVEVLKRSVSEFNAALTESDARMLLRILASRGHLGRLLRSMYDVGLLERLFPEMARARGLLQFNQYHSYTVDEHTFRAVEAAEAFERDAGPVGTAYRAIRHKELLHLALLLHDLGKGLERDHSDVGREIAERVAERLFLSPHQRDSLVFLVHRHLRMAHMAFRRDIDDPQLLLHFSHEVGSAELLRMLYVLTAADLTAVGPGVWTDWKAELLTELYDRALLILSGKHLQFQEKERFARIKRRVRELVPSEAPGSAGPSFAEWVGAQLDAFPPHYLIATEPERIAGDIELIRRLGPGQVIASGRFDEETGTLDYRVVTHESHAAGCFHKIAGVLTAHRLEILRAQISTSTNGTIVDSFRVLDRDFSGRVPESRIRETEAAIRRVLAGEVQVKELFRRHKRFDAARNTQPVSNLSRRVTIDNESSDRCTVLDVFAHDRTGLLYTLARTIFDLDLSVMRAKIATHFDQVVDVFYVTDSAGRKIHDEGRLFDIRQRLEQEIDAFEQGGYREFIS